MASNIKNRSSNSKNPANPESALFKRLTRLFSGPIINYRHQTETGLRHRNIGKYASRLRSPTQAFKRNNYNPFETINATNMANVGRMLRYYDYEQMEMYPELNSALDLFAEEMTTHSALQPLLTINCANEEIRDILSVLYKNVLNIEFNLYSWCRQMCKYGDFFMYLDLDPKKGVINAIGLPVNEIERLEGEDKTNPYYVTFQHNLAGITYENWQIAHFRILGNDKYAPYGSSCLDASRRIWRQLDLLENTVISYRIVRSPERRVFYIDMGNSDPKDYETIIEKIKTSMKRNQIADPNSGQVDLRYNANSVEEDYYIPTRQGSATKIDTLPGGQYTGDVDDIKYFRDKLFSALKIPASYLSRGEGGDEDKNSLSTKDIRFARTILRLQLSVISELEKIGMIHLYTLGFTGEDLISFKLSLSNPSRIAEIQELEYWKTKFDVASSATEGMFSSRWISKKLFNLSEEELLRNQREQYYDAFVKSQLTTLAEPKDTSGGGMGGDDELDMGDEEENKEDEVLLAKPPEEGGELPPARRQDDPYLTPGAKGKKYYPVKYDNRPSGARKRHMFAQGSGEMGSNTKRNIFKGYANMESHAKGIYEGIEKFQKEFYEENKEKESSYIKEEKEITNLNGELKLIFESLENRKKKTDEDPT